MSKNSSPKENDLKVALPKGSLMGDVASLLADVGFAVPGYDPSSRVYRFRAERPAHVFVKVFAERDIPVQVAVGNYDIGIAGSDWIDELIIKFKKIGIVKLFTLGLQRETLFAAAAPGFTLESAGGNEAGAPVRIVTEYPNLAEHFARRRLLPHYKIFPVWGSAQNYPPDGAEVAIIRVGDAGEVEAMGLSVVDEVMPCEAAVICCRESFETKDLSRVLSLFEERR
jgi:ATP phosphoribosyltransferase